MKPELQNCSYADYFYHSLFGYPLPSSQDATLNAANQAGLYEHSIATRARALVSGIDPMLNLAPYIELVKQADRLGVDVMKRSQKP